MRQGGASVSDGVRGVGGGAAQIRDSPFSTGIPRGMAVEAGPLTELEGLHLKRYVVITEA